MNEFSSSFFLNDKKNFYHQNHWQNPELYVFLPMSVKIKRNKTKQIEKIRNLTANI